MNKKDFIAEVKKNIAEMDSKELQTCLIKFAKEISNDMREEMLEFLESFLENKEKETESQKILRQMSEQTLEEKMEKLEDWLDQIEDGELCLTADGYEEYGHGWEEDWVWEYHDNDEVIQKITVIIEFAKSCMSDKKYEEAISIFNRLLDMEVWVENDWDNFTLDLKQMEEEELIELDLEEFALMILYTDYQVQETEKRAENIYLYFQYPIFKNIHMENIRNIGKEKLKEEEAFWKDWIELLASKEGNIEARLLKEAILYKEGIEGLAKIAEKCYIKHPGMYLEALTKYEKDHKYQQVIEIGMKAIQLIDKKYQIRSKIAMKVSFAEYYIGNKQEMKKLWYEVYVSDTTELNYLRLFLDEELALSYGKKARNIQEIIIQNSSQVGINRRGELAENIIVKNSQSENCFTFFFGEFEKAKNICVNPKGSLGWSGEFIGLGLKLFLLYFYQEKKLKTAIGEIAKDVSEWCEFHNNEEFYFLEKEDFELEKDDKNTFWMAFRKWRDYFGMEDMKKEQYISWLEDIIEKRTKAIVGGQFRAHYGSVAVLINALGEVKESMGHIGAKQEMQKTYKQMFPRHTAFHKEMNSLI